MKVIGTELDNGCLKEARRRRITVTSSLNEISMDQLGNIGSVDGEDGGRPLLRPPPSF